MKLPIRLLAALSLASLTACAGPALFNDLAWADPDPDLTKQPPDWQRDQRFREEGMPEYQEPDPTDPEADPVPLLGWDGGVVDSPTRGNVSERSAERGLGSDESRTQIIDLYQEALNERDALRVEVKTLTAALEEAQLLTQTTDSNRQSLAERVQHLEQEQSRLLNENQDLVARLTTAQIRRLEAEKMLLEFRIGEIRRRQAQEDVAGDQEPGQ